MKDFFTILNPIVQENFTMKQATETNTSEVKALLYETAKWFENQGSIQWNALLDGHDTHRTEEAIKRGNVFICMNEKDLAGMVMLLENPSEWDKNLWDLNDDEPNDAVYLHRLAINRKYANLKLGHAILRWCRQHILFLERKKLRLDCLANNPFLNEFYEKANFTYFGEKDGYSLFEATLKKL